MILANKEIKKNQLILGLAIVAVVAVTILGGLLFMNKSQKKTAKPTQATLSQQLTTDYVKLQDTLSREQAEQADVQGLLGQGPTKKDMGK